MNRAVFIVRLTSFPRDLIFKSVVVLCTLTRLKYERLTVFKKLFKLHQFIRFRFVQEYMKIVSKVIFDVESKR